MKNLTSTSGVLVSIQPSRWLRPVLFGLALLTVQAVPSSAQAAGAQEQLWDAAQSGDTTAVLAAIARGARVDSLDTRTAANGRRALNWAALGDHPAVIRILVKRGAQINLANVTGFTPLHHAAEAGSLAAARALIALGADPKLTNAGGLRAVDVATMRDKLAVAALLDSLPNK